MLADELVVTTDENTAELGYTTCTTIQGADLSGGLMTVTAEAIVALGSPHQAEGQVILTGLNAGGQLGISNIGSSGKDGVSVELNQALSIHMQWLPIGNAASTATGASLRLTGIGSIGGIVDQPLPPSCVTDFGIQLEITTCGDGETMYTIQVLLAGVLQGEVTGLSGSIATVLDWPSDGG